MIAKIKKHLGIFFLSLILAVCLIFLVFVYIVSGNYKDKFIAGSSINGIDVGNMTQEEAISAINDKLQSYELTLTFADGQTALITAKDLDLNYSDDGQVEKLLSSQESLFWFAGILGIKNSYTINESYLLNDESLSSTLSQLPQFQAENVTPPSNASIEISDNGSVSLVNEVTGNELNTDTVSSKIKECVLSGETSLSLTYEDGDYLQPSVLSTDEELQTRLNAINTFLSSSVTYELHDGSTLTLDYTTLRDWLTVNDTDPYRYSLDSETITSKVSEFVSSLAEKDNTIYTTEIHTFKDRDPIEKDCDQYGYIVDEETEKTQLYNELMSGTVTSRKPNYSDAQEQRSVEETTFVVLSISQQKVTLYKDNEVILQADCVTGMADDPDRLTPTGVFSVYWKTTDRYMKGDIDETTGEPEYVSFVNFAVYFNGGIAFHDASWRTTFGGEIYKTDGSHGCINMSYDDAKLVYDTVSVGTTVFVDP